MAATPIINHHSKQISMVDAHSRRHRTATPDDEEEPSLPSDYKAYVPVAKRRAQLISTLTGKSQFKKPKTLTRAAEELQNERNDQMEDYEKAKEKVRNERTLLQEAQEGKKRRAIEDAEKSAAELEAEKEAAVLADMERAQKKLAGVQELAHGTAYTESLKTR